MTIFKKFDHIGIVVNDLKKAMEELERFFGYPCEGQVEIKAAGIQTAFYPLGGGHLELIEFQKPMSDVDPMVLRPAAGVQHVAWQVEDFDGAFKTLTEKGLQVVRGFPRQGARGRVAFFYPTPGLDLMVEICETQDDKP